MKQKGKCGKVDANVFYHCGRCCAEIKCTDKDCPWNMACRDKDYKQCGDYIEPLAELGGKV